MSLKVLELSVPEEFPFSNADKEGIRLATSDFSFKAKCNIDGVVGWLNFCFKMGCKYNGASNPIHWPIDNYYGDPIKDAPGLGHDDLYAWGGNVNGLGRKLKAGECDDYIRGAMREAGFSRAESGIVDRCVRTFAHWFHFGVKNDKEKMHNYSTIVWEVCK